MGEEQFFWCMVGLAWLIETGATCWIIERYQTKVKRIIRKSEVRRKKHLHDYYCSQEAERLYNKFNFREGGMNHE